MEIRAATAADAADIAELLGQLGYPATATDVASRLNAVVAESGSVVLVAAEDERVIGMATLVVRRVLNNDAPLARLMSVVVDESHRSRGIGRRLIDAAEDRARTAGCFAIEVTSALRRERAHDFYRDHGYQDTSLRFVKRF